MVVLKQAGRTLKSHNRSSVFKSVESNSWDKGQVKASVSDYCGLVCEGGPFVSGQNTRRIPSLTTSHTERVTEGSQSVLFHGTSVCPNCVRSLADRPLSSFFFIYNPLKIFAVADFPLKRKWTVIIVFCASRKKVLSSRKIEPKVLLIWVSFNCAEDGRVVWKLFPWKRCEALSFLPFLRRTRRARTKGREIAWIKIAKPDYIVAQCRLLSAHLFTCGMVVLILAGRRLKFHDRTAQFLSLSCRSFLGWVPGVQHAKVGEARR